MKKADLIKRIEKLEQLRAEVAETTTGQDTDGTPKRSEPEPISDTPETKKTPPDRAEPSHGITPYQPGYHRKVEPVPERLKGISYDELVLMQTDGALTAEESAWLGRRRGPQIDFTCYGEHGWMVM